MNTPIAINQLAPHAGDPNTNFTIIKKAIAANKVSGALLSIFPEDFLYGIMRSRAQLEAAGRQFDYWITQFSKLAQQHSIDIIPGSLPRLIDGKLYNTTVYIDKTGVVKTIYAKNNLWLSEREEYEPSLKPPVVFDSVLGKTAIIICWDLFDRHLFDAAVQQGAKWIINIAFWSTNQSNDLRAQRGKPSARYKGASDSLVLDTLIKARVVEYNIGFIFVNFAGVHNYIGNTGPSKATSANRSQVVSPCMTVHYRLTNRHETSLLCDIPDIAQGIEDFEIAYGRREDVVNRYPRGGLKDHITY